jgi:release factor glutamine methyltransferase
LTATFSPTDLPPIVTALRAAGCVFAEDEARLLVSSAGTPAALTAMIEQRVAGLPLEQVIGWAEFCGLRIAIDAGVFVPRRRTEFLARTAITLGWQAARPGQPLVLLDLCCGSGAVGAAVAAALGHAELHAADVDPAAVRCARRNLAAGKGRAAGRVYQGDLYDPLPPGLRGRVDILTANVPYIPAGEIALLPPEARLHEPRVALDGGADGLDLLRRVAAGAPQWLAPGGSLLSEVSERQAPAARKAVAAAGLGSRLAVSEDLNATVVVGTRYGAGRPGVPAR